MPRLIIALLAASLVSVAVPAAAHHADLDTRVAHHVSDDARVAAAPKDAKTDAKATARLPGTYKVLLDDETKKQLEETRKQVAEAGEAGDAMAAELLKMMEAMASIEVTFTATEMTMKFADQSETVTYEVLEETEDTVKLKTSGTKNAPNGNENFTIKVTEQGLVMSKEGDEQAITFVRKQ